MSRSCKVSSFTYDLKSGRWQNNERPLIAEVPLQIWINGEHLATLHRTPGNEFLLAAGYLYYQGLINREEDISAQRLVTAESNSETPLTTDSVRLTISKPISAVSPLTAAAIWSIIAPQIQKSPPRKFFLPAALIPPLPQAMLRQQALYTSTAGAHAVALINQEGRILHCEEDVGRANALDKIVGYCVCNKIEMGSLAALFSGRINLEMAVKIARAGFPLALSVSAPTAGAVQILKQAGVTYAGSLRDTSFTLFCGTL
ncbi:MAG: formate dehydrogenase accessory sulfurtransferase FdhD [Deltaproteobacteria bacterium]|nr:formate dehydrogenase accessory sulfurtransferase FdhD [Deltaproteobacteria bacterium]